MLKQNKMWAVTFIIGVVVGFVAIQITHDTDNKINKKNANIFIERRVSSFNNTPKEYWEPLFKNNMKDFLIKNKKQKSIAVIDASIYRQKGFLYKDIFYRKMKSKTTRNNEENPMHGVNVVNIIKGLNPNQKIIFYPYEYNNVFFEQSISESIYDAIEANVEVINISLIGKGFGYLEYLAIKLANDKGIKIIVSAGNNGLNLDSNCDLYPACYKKHDTNLTNLIVVGGIDRRTLKRSKNSNYGSIVDVYTYYDDYITFDSNGLLSTNSGTSFATPVISTYIANMEKKEDVIHNLVLENPEVFVKGEYVRN